MNRLNLKAIGKRIQLYRRKRGITQKALASIIGMSTQAISGYEQGRSMPAADILCFIADVLGTTPDILLGYDAAKSTVSKQTAEHILSGICKLIEAKREELQRYERLGFGESISMIRSELNAMCYIATGLKGAIDEGEYGA